MKLSALQQSYMNRRPGSFRGASLPLDSSSSDSSIKSPAAIFWLVLHGLCCLISLILGFRFSRLVFFFLFSTSSTTTLYTTPFHPLTNAVIATSIGSAPAEIPPPVVNRTESLSSSSSSSSRVVVGRHGIRIRPWPHPNPSEVMKAHEIIERVQREQRFQFGVKNPKPVIVITPSYVRTFQTLHLTGVMHSLMLVPYYVVWIVVEAGGVSNETASIIEKSGLKTFHVGFNQKMPNSWEGRHILEAKMRLRGLRVVRDKKLDGIVMFADDSNMHSMELFDEIQNVKWFGAVSVGILIQSVGGDDSSSLTAATTVEKEAEEKQPNPAMPVQGPACNASNKLVGWHTFNSLPYEGKSAVHIDDRAIVLPRKLEWAGFVLNSRLLWKETEDKPEWVNDLDLVGEDIESPLFLLKDPSMVEPLGSCGRQVLLWWLRVEARSDSKFPPGWIIDPPLEITVPAKRTPWPDVPPELPMNEKVVISQEQTVKHSTKTRSPRSKRRSKRKHEAKSEETQVSARQSEKN